MDIDDFDEWLDSGKSKRSNHTQQNITIPPPPTTAALTKEVIEDNVRLQNWKKGRQDTKDNPL